MFRLKNSFKRLVSISIAALFIVSACAVISKAFGSRAVIAEENGQTVQTRVVGYLPDWSYSAYKNIDFSALTHVNIAFCNPDSKGQLNCGIPDVEMEKIVEKAHANNVKVIAALGGGGYGDPYRSLISSPENISALNAKIVDYCESHNLDGIDLDIELASSDSIWDDYGAWVTELRSICDEHGWLLSTATAQWVAERVTPQTFALFDYLNVMAYDNDSKGSTSHSSYEFSVDCMKYFNTVKNVPKDKLVLGVPFYGRGYNSAGSLDWSIYVSFVDLVNADTDNFYNDNYNGVAYTGANTMREKCDLAKEYGGIMIWEITLDAEGEYSLLGVIKQEMLSVVQLPATEPPATDIIDSDDENNAVWIVLGITLPAVAIAAVICAIVIVRKKKQIK